MSGYARMLIAGVLAVASSGCGITSTLTYDFYPDIPRKGYVQFSAAVENSSAGYVEGTRIFQDVNGRKTSLGKIPASSSSFAGQVRRHHESYTEIKASALPGQATFYVDTFGMGKGEPSHKFTLDIYQATTTSVTVVYSNLTITPATIDRAYVHGSKFLRIVDPVTRRVTIHPLTRNSATASGSATKPTPSEQELQSLLIKQHEALKAQGIESGPAVLEYPDGRKVVINVSTSAAAYGIQSQKERPASGGGPIAAGEQVGNYVLNKLIPGSASQDGFTLISLQFVEEKGAITALIRTAYPSFPKKAWNLFITVLDANGQIVAADRDWIENPGIKIDDWQSDDTERKLILEAGKAPHGLPARFQIEIKPAKRSR